MEKLIYMDNAATTSTAPEVVSAMLPFFTEYYGNPSSVYNFAQKSKMAIEDAREIIADSIGAAKSNEIYFTGGGSESDNWALKSAAFGLRDKGNHIITTKIEHHAILNTCAYLEKNGFEVTYLDVDSEGFVSLEDVENAITDKTILISVMLANNEIGTIEPVCEIGEIAHKHGILFHTDAVQAMCHVPINVTEMNIDLLSASAHKFHGPKGVGFMYMKNTAKLEPFIHGGAQERARRAGTSNVPGIVGMGKAVKLALDTLDKDTHTIFINAKNLEDAKETADTIAHEMRHAYQYVRAEELIESRDLLYSIGFIRYIQPAQNQSLYEQQLVETDARDYAQRYKDYIQSMENKK